jgi:hypothetical protein
VRRYLIIIAVLGVSAFLLGRFFPVGLPDQRVPTTITESTTP